MTTERLCYTDSYIRKFESEVTAASDDFLRISLKRTAFYPTSGGQPHDLGTLNGIPVLDVIDNGETISHVLAAPLAVQAVQGEIDWHRRYDHMQQHTGQHLLSAVFEQLFHIATLSFHMGGEVSTIELGAREISTAQFEAVTLRFTELARANPHLAVTFEDAAQSKGLRKTSQREGLLRIVEIPGVDRSACGGTHVASLAEVLPLQIRESEKVRGNLRINFVCGNRAILRGQSDFQILTRIARGLALAPSLVESHISLLQQRLIAAEKQNTNLLIEAATRQGLDLYKSTTPGADGMRRVVLAELAIDENARAKVKAFASQPKAVLLLHSEDSLLLGCSPDAGINAGALLKQALAKAGARGGGSPTLAQGNLPGHEILRDLMQSAGLSF